MDDLGRTRAMAAAAGIALDDELTTELFTAVAPVLTEWSLNAAGDHRGAFRVALWSDDHPRVGAWLERRAPAAAAVRARLPVEAMEGVGAARGDRTVVRWWQLAPIADGRQLAASARTALPALAPWCDDLARLAGSSARCTAIGVEHDHDAIVRSTIYVELLEPAACVAVLERIGCPPSPLARTFFKDLLGLDPAWPRPWPRVWLGRSVGRDGGWKFYTFARGDPHRRSDDDLLDRLAAPAATRAAWRCLADGTGPGAGVIQLAAINLGRGDASPRITLYLATR